jgi:hypothetical protein
MPPAKESDIQIDFPTAISVRNFDKEPHGLSHCMKAVDFVVEFSEKIFFIEIKDPDNPNATVENKTEFIEKLTSGVLIEKDLKTKCRDSFLYEYCMERVHKPIHYCVIIGSENLSEADLQNQSDLLAKHIPVTSPSSNPWKRCFIQSSHIFNFRTWNSIFKDFPITRISQHNPQGRGLHA